MFQTNPSRVEGESLTGMVKMWEPSKGYGFVSKVSDGGEDIFVHYTKVIAEHGRFPAIAPGTEVRLTYHCRQGRDTGIKVTDVNGAPLQGFFDKADAIAQISGDTIQPIGERKAGSVKWFNDEKGFGFIQPETPGDGSEDLFVHMKEVEGDLTSLVEGERVEYNVGMVKGRYRAINVSCDRSRVGLAQGTEGAASTPQTQQASIVYNPTTGTYQYANASTAQYGASGNVMYVDPATYGMSQNNQLSYMPQTGQLQPGQTFISNGQLYMMPPAQTAGINPSTQAQTGTAYQYTQSPLTQQGTKSSLTQGYMPQSSQNLSQLPQQNHGQLYQQQTSQIQQNQLSSSLGYLSTPSYLSQNNLQQYSQASSQLQSKQYIPGQQSAYSQPQSGLHKRSAPNSQSDMEQPRKMIRQSKSSPQMHQNYHQ